VALICAGTSARSGSASRQIGSGRQDQLDGTGVRDNDGLEGRARRDLACRAAAVVAHRHGLGIDDLTIVKDSNNTIVGVNRQVVAKDATSTLPGRMRSTANYRC
jgi:hypothetical protein